jgi:hypothetical protein
MLLSETVLISRSMLKIASMLFDECRMGGLFTEHVVGEHKNALRQREEHRRVGANAPQWQYISFLKER